MSKSESLTGWVLYSSVPPEPDFESLDDDFDVLSEMDKQVPVKPTRVGMFKTSDEFWVLQNSVIPPSAIWGRGAYYYMKKGVKPTPDDPAHSGGISYTMYFDVLCQEDAKSRKIESLFLHILLSIVSRTFPKSEQITAIIFESTKEKTSISCWTPPLKTDDATNIENSLKTVFGKEQNFTKKKLLF